MKVSKILIVMVVLAIAAYFVVNGMKSEPGPNKAKSGWFSKLDANGDGKISAEEHKVMDGNNDGKISAEEANAYGIPQDEFKKWDKNGDGYISQEEMKTYGG
jgi:Ca2+-binding EF-hand superfamily protein